MEGWPQIYDDTSGPHQSIHGPMTLHLTVDYSAEKKIAHFVFSAKSERRAIHITLEPSTSSQYATTFYEQEACVCKGRSDAIRLSQLWFKGRIVAALERIGHENRQKSDAEIAVDS